MAVHLAIRPRLRLPPEPPAARRRRWRLPPLALPAAGYWVGMAALTYFFAHLGPHPLESALATRAEAQPPPRDAGRGTSGPLREEHDATPPPPVPSAIEPTPEPAPEPEPMAATAPAAPSADPDLPLAAEPPVARRSASLAIAPEASPAPAVTPAPAAPRLAFPEFTDSSRPARRERAGDGPRIDSIFEPARDDERPTPAPSEAAPPEREPAPATAVTSCEAAIARNNESIELGAPRGPVDITREAYASILQNGRYLSGCSIPDRTVFEICAAVKDGRAVGITVVSNPARAELNACVRRAVSRLRFPANPKLDVTHTRFDAVRR